MIDLCNAFDTVDFDVLLAKLTVMGVKSTDWFRSYLTENRQCVNVGDVVIRMVIFCIRMVINTNTFWYSYNYIFKLLLCKAYPFDCVLTDTCLSFYVVTNKNT